MIRKTKPNEINAIYELIAIAAKQGQILLRSKEEIGQVLPSFYVAIENDKVVGCCSLEIYSPKLAELRSLAVLPEHQGKKIGRQLVNVCIQEAKEKNIFEILAVTDKVAFFEKLGFSTCLNNQYPMFLRP